MTLGSKRRRMGLVLWSLCAACAFSGSFALGQTAPRKVNFNRDIRPILSEACFQCHGPDAGQRKADLRLDTNAGLHGTGDGPHVIELGKPEESELFLRLTSDDPEARMPPAKSGKTLTAAQIELIRRWIAEGAEFQGHWAYIAPSMPEIPAVPAGEFVRNDIDRFVLAKLQDRGLQPSPVSDPVVLMRRLHWDLTGLPPQPEVVEKFAKDPSLTAYEEVVDRLLASPEYGERMAMFWLDLVRYADTNGYHGDNHEDRDMYRDWVINSFNRNQPFDEFTIAQLAGDLLPEPTREQRIASGYNRLLMTTREGGAQAKEYLAKYAADRVRNVSSVWLASTLGCCECHDHKFDPFTTRDFYSLAAYFADIQEVAVGEQSGVPFPTAEQQQAFEQAGAQVTQLKQQLDGPHPHLAAAQTAWETRTLAELATKKSGWGVIKPASVQSSGGATLAVQDDLSVLSTGANPAQDNYTVSFTVTSPRLTGIRLEALSHPSLNNGRLSRANGNFVLTGVELQVQPPGTETPQAVKFKEAVADFAQDGFPVANAIDDKADTGWAVSGHTQTGDRKAVFLLAEPLTVTPETRLTLVLKHQSIYSQHNIGRFRISASAADKPDLVEGGLPETVVAALQIPADKRDDAQQKAVADYYRTLDPVLQDLRQKIQNAETERGNIQKSFRTTLVSMSGPPREMRVLPRGNWLDDSGEIVLPASPASITLNAPKSDARQTRLDLARWMVSPENPLVARVFVNRLWKITFGQGLVKSLEDFGSQGSWPTHPELLDWLALDFQQHGWNVKRTLKLIVMSGTYRQGSVASHELKQVDPFNIWLARQGRFRLDAEMIRDGALQTSGLLVEHVGGPSVKPYQPAGYWSYLNFPVREWQNDQGSDLYRRGLYTYWCRTFLYPSFKTFDAPTREECTVERPRSNTPLQALVLLNDPAYVEVSRNLAERILREGGPDASSRIQYAYRVVLTRSPRPEELQILTELYAKHREQYAADKAAAENLLKIGASPLPPGVDLADLAATTSLARVIYNLHETITRN